MTLGTIDRSPRRMLRLYRRQLGAHVRSSLEYEADFTIAMIGAMLTQVTGIVFIDAVFDRVPAINGWERAEVIVIFAMVVLAEGVVSLFGNGIWYLPWRANQGELDYTLTRPYPPLLQVMSYSVGLNGIGNLVVGTILMVWGLRRVDVDWTVGRIALAIIFFVCAVAIKQAITIISNATSLWFGAGSNSLAYGLHQVGDLARYPITVYSTVLKVVLTVFVPFAFISFFPAAAILDRGESAKIGMWTPAVAIAVSLAARSFFYRGIRRYESAGS